MLLDIRTYTCRPGMLKKQLAVYEKYGRDAQHRIAGNPLGFLTTETGNINQYVHIWVYTDAADREAKRQAMNNDPDWAKYREERDKLGALVSQENKLMKPVGFYPAPEPR
jgi:hypothetical protein